MAKTELYMVTEGGRIIYVGDGPGASRWMRQGRSMWPLTDADADVYVRHGCPGLAQRLALNPNGGGA